jgi:ribosomal protein L28|tara:strand:- start:153 stop:356 length:204 start_codon:yes stop_codon:yes gene_type:complete
MEKNYWQIDEDLYKVHISADVFKELEKDFRVDDMAKYMKDGEIYAYDIMIKKNKLQEVLQRLEEFDC